MAKPSKKNISKPKTTTQIPADFLKSLEFFKKDENRRRKDRNQLILSQKETIELRKSQLLWFVAKLVELGSDPITMEYNEYDESICFPAGLLQDQTDIFPRDLYTDTDEQRTKECIEYCRNMLQKIRNDAYRLESKNKDLHADRFSWEENNGFYTVGHAFFINCNNLPILEAYLQSLNDGKKLSKAVSVRVPIEKIEILEDKTEQKRITVYINGNYERPRDFSRGKNWGKMYDLAKSQEIDYDKDFFDYFNYSSLNPLYTERGGSSITKIVRVEDGLIVPNIKISVVSQNKISRQLKTA